MKRFAMTLALMCALSISIFAGDMPTDGKAGTPPPPPTTSSTANSVLVSVLLTILSLR